MPSRAPNAQFLRNLPQFARPVKTEARLRTVVLKRDTCRTATGHQSLATISPIKIHFLSRVALTRLSRTQVGRRCCEKRLLRRCEHEHARSHGVTGRWLALKSTHLSRPRRVNSRSRRTQFPAASFRAFPANARNACPRKHTQLTQDVSAMSSHTYCRQTINRFYLRVCVSQHEIISSDSA